MKLLLHPPKSPTNTTTALSKDVHECLLYEQNTLQALEFLIQDQISPTPALLVDTDLVRCFRCALELGSDFRAPAPEAYRPMLMLLLYRFPMLLLPHIDGKHEADMSLVGATRKYTEALQSSLTYEYVTNPQLQRVKAEYIQRVNTFTIE
ncbi:hypothetical protein PHMEG_00029542 [Phytophthora megakarya]|uniref:Uncharacterized protein n=1 Tax=Phytophthora megakarya TaxID=4795 RepID=A0A225V1W3_9STRA|nr:hypothetical protein PHMEG_00029542 [Phytophthora megakarya]